MMKLLRKEGMFKIPEMTSGQANTTTTATVVAFAIAMSVIGLKAVKKITNAAIQK